MSDRHNLSQFGEGEFENTGADPANGFPCGSVIIRRFIAARSLEYDGKGAQWHLGSDRLVGLDFPSFHPSHDCAFGGSAHDSNRITVTIQGVFQVGGLRGD
jgi:hypothetical protein